MNITQHLENKLNSVKLLPELRADLLAVLRQSEKSQQNRFLHRLPLAIFHALGGEDEQHVEPFVVAWACLHSVLLRLDHLQDNDPEVEPLPTSPNVAASYNLLFAAYVVASSALDELDESNIPPSRLLQLRRLWNESILTSASGQYYDLLYFDTFNDDRLMLDQYQQVAETKSGALFALAFAGIALVTIDDDTLITACRYIGNIYGTLLQLADDLMDNNISASMNLYERYDRFACITLGRQEDVSKSAEGFFEFVRLTYIEQVEHLLAQINHLELCSCLRQLFSALPPGDS
jgi:geranylgeranyl pyrophosphate synthase